MERYKYFNWIRITHGMIVVIGINSKSTETRCRYNCIFQEVFLRLLFHCFYFQITLRVPRFSAGYICTKSLISNNGVITTPSRPVKFRIYHYNFESNNVLSDRYYCFIDRHHFSIQDYALFSFF